MKPAQVTALKKKNAKGGATSVYINPLCDNLEGPANQFLNLLHTDVEWEKLNTLFTQHLGAETAKGLELRTCKANIMSAFNGHRVVQGCEEGLLL